MKINTTQLPLGSLPQWAATPWDDAEREAWRPPSAEIAGLRDQVKRLEAREHQRDLLIETHAEQIRALMQQLVLRRHDRADGELPIRNATDDWSAAPDFSIVHGPHEIELRFGGSDQRQIIEAAWASLDTGASITFGSLRRKLNKPDLRPQKCFRVKRAGRRAVVHPAVATGFIIFGRGSIRLCQVGAHPLAHPVGKRKTEIG